MNICQIKGNFSRSISLDEQGVTWLCDSFSSIQSGASQVFTRYEQDREILLAFEANKFGGFMRLVDSRNLRSSTIIEGWRSEGFKSFFSTLLSQRDRLTVFEKLPQVDFGVVCSDRVSDFGVIFLVKESSSKEGGSISSLIFKEDLHYVGLIYDPDNISSNAFVIRDTSQRT
ncbi:unnamed protein product [Cuscuta europaea]|uniref:Uncharacterized protein n=1 Tax=Cuscuta europaea TaxID=41803 RepID=A0A9P1E8D9_CUSEU|nr:unnamed protein product [Cuscuta europaea]